MITRTKENIVIFVVLCDIERILRKGKVVNFYLIRTKPKIIYYLYAIVKK